MKDIKEFINEGWLEDYPDDIKSKSREYEAPNPSNKTPKTNLHNKETYQNNIDIETDRIIKLEMPEYIKDLIINIAKQSTGKVTANSRKQLRQQTIDLCKQIQNQMKW